MKRLITITSCVLLLATAGAAQRQLTSGSGGGERQPVVSADGSTVAFVVLRAGVRELFTIPTDGSAPATQRTTGAAVRVGIGPFDQGPSLSISADGTRVTYWNAGGIHVLDTVAGSDTVVATTSVLPYPHLSPDGSTVVYQRPIEGRFEVVVVPAAGGTSTAITSLSGPGRRLPQASDWGVAYQNMTAGDQELFLYDNATGTTTQLTTGSGGGDRHARWSADGRYVTYGVRSSVTGTREVWTVVAATGVARPVTMPGGVGNRLPLRTDDDEVVYQDLASNLEVYRIDDQGQNQVALTSGSRPGLRRPTSDRHGHVVVYQAPTQFSVEVFAVDVCPEASFGPFGQHGTPSVGSLSSFQQWYRCDLTLGLDTALAPGGSALLLVGNTPLAGLPIAGAPGSFLYTQPVTSEVVTLDAQGNAGLTVPVGPMLSGSIVYQWAVLDAAANAAGFVTSEGVQLTF